MIYTAPNLLTLCRILIIPGIVISLYMESTWGNWIAFSLYTAACITDFFDGYIARVTHQISPIGKFLDPIADKLLVSTVLISAVGLSRLTYWHLIPVIAIVCREIFISGLREFLADYHINMPVSSMGKWKTTFQMFSLGFLITYPSTPSEWHIHTIGVSTLWVSAILTIWSGITYMSVAIRHATAIDKT